MKVSDQYHKWVEWSEEDQAYIGKCPDLITGIHGDDPVRVYQDLCEMLDEVISHFQESGRELPRSRTKPMMEIS
jgi:predicted RNase H-like HicB family nuclease